MGVNTASANNLNLATSGHLRVHDDVYIELNATERRTARQLHDIYHGVWHLLACVFCIQAALITVEGLTGTR